MTKIQFSLAKSAKALVLMTAVLLAGCGKNNGSSTEDSSASGSVASAIGGAYNGSSTSGTEAFFQADPSAKKNSVLEFLNPVPKALASNACPTFTSSVLSACLSTPQTLSYSDCSFSNSEVTWNGGTTFTCSGTLGSPTVTRAVINGTTRTNSFGSVITMKSSGITTFNGATPSGGTTFTPTSMTINGVELTGTRGNTEVFDHVITSSALTRSGSNVSGTVTVYHNLAKVIGTSTINVSFASGCCTPVSGTITTSFQAYGGFSARTGFNGASETLTFNSCGNATYTGPEGYTGTVTIANCF